MKATGLSSFFVGHGRGGPVRFNSAPM